MHIPNEKPTMRRISVAVPKGRRDRHSAADKKRKWLRYSDVCRVEVDEAVMLPFSVKLSNSFIDGLKWLLFFISLFVMPSPI